MSNEALVGIGTADEAMPTHELMGWLNEAERSRFVALQETFETDGWRLIAEYATAKITEHGINGANAPTWEESRKHLGARLAWEQVARMQTEFMAAFEAAAVSAKEEAAEAATADNE